METLFFLIITLVAIVSALLVVTCKNPINSALALVMTFFCLATYYVMLDAPFMAAVQVMVYAGAIMVLIVFTIMLLNIRVDATKRHSHKIVLGSIIGFFTLINTAFIIMRSRVAMPNGPLTGEMIRQQGHTELIGREMFTTFLLPFEITSILLLVAIIGAVILAKKKL
ncbi:MULTISPECIES: NADH-quinone oxidoreductase subunit J [Oryzomonas]|uniref:NADH-quinone oxidoreductase subunit J n=2 Tax=Oryzomonas TaxID=2855184 RepID=A0A5A9XEG6_9BACT|nr:MULTISPECIES: NADH-quinone oxidoreductase subunit J [Oryzomonas]KAA0891592.1 NADH-quinone oxidoreductase subunit J [Oryzomonas rubra]KAB0672048.1 NADH-quinone oxidoreductase subunit J [Oryzomonas sagensis]